MNQPITDQDLSQFSILQSARCNSARLHGRAMSRDVLTLRPQPSVTRYRSADGEQIFLRMLSVIVNERLSGVNFSTAPVLGHWRVSRPLPSMIGTYDRARGIIASIVLPRAFEQTRSDGRTISSQQKNKTEYRES